MQVNECSPCKEESEDYAEIIFNFLSILNQYNHCNSVDFFTEVFSSENVESVELTKLVIAYLNFQINNTFCLDESKCSFSNGMFQVYSTIE